MPPRKRAPSERGRVGRVSFYLHHGNWWLYYRDGGEPVRRNVAQTRDEAEQVAAQVNAQLANGADPLDLHVDRRAGPAAAVPRLPRTRPQVGGSHRPSLPRYHAVPRRLRPAAAEAA